MNSSVNVSGTSQVELEQLLPADLCLVEGSAQKRTADSFHRIIISCEILADILTIMAAIRLGYLIYGATRFGHHIYVPLRLIWVAGAAFAMVMVLMLDRVGAYRRGNSLLRVRETEQVIRVSVEALLIVLAISFFAHVQVPRWLLALCLSLIPFLLFVQKGLMYHLVHALHSRGYGNERVVIYGAGCTGRRVFSLLKGSPKLGLLPVAVVDDDPSKIGSTLFEMAYGRRSCAQVVGGPVSRDMISACSADLVIIAIPSIGRNEFLSTVREAQAANVKVSFVPNQLLSSDSWIDYRDIDGILLASLGRPARRLCYEGVKRICDILGSATLIFLGSPLFLLLALLVKLDSNGPAVFHQERIGRDGKPFRMFKFRTMRSAAPRYDYSPRESCDPRITRVGRFLRKTSLDELPQLFNVLWGSMSLVGPRPEMPFITAQYNEQHRQRLQVKPGITGLWQLSGDRAFLIHENIEYDLYYIKHRNLFMDMAILFHTSIFAMRGV
jgi:exopolysaccharide biosynthesis polyprenyl glycosylphosphotransferase